jgi:hypothetical protein
MTQSGHGLAFAPRNKPGSPESRAKSYLRNVNRRTSVLLSRKVLSQVFHGRSMNCTAKFCGASLLRVARRAIDCRVWLGGLDLSAPVSGGSRDRRILGGDHCRQRQAVRIIVPEHKGRRKQQGRQQSTAERPFEGQQRSDQRREKNEHREHGDIEPVHIRPIDCWQILHFEITRIVPMTYRRSAPPQGITNTVPPAYEFEFR